MIADGSASDTTIPALGGHSTPVGKAFYVHTVAGVVVYVRIRAGQGWGGVRIYATFDNRTQVLMTTIGCVRHHHKIWARR